MKKIFALAMLIGDGIVAKSALITLHAKHLTASHETTSAVFYLGVIVVNVVVVAVLVRSGRATAEARSRGGRSGYGTWPNSRRGVERSRW
jgi:hypothetical protein